MSSTVGCVISGVGVITILTGKSALLQFRNAVVHFEPWFGVGFQGWFRVKLRRKYYDMKSGDMQIIGSLLYLVTVGVWVNENMDQPTQIGWALIVSICG